MSNVEAVFSNMQKGKCISLQPYSVANNNEAMINDNDAPNLTVSSNAIGVSNAAHLNDANESKGFDQTVRNLQVSDSLNENTNNIVQNISDDICTRLAIIDNMEISEQQPESGTLFTVDSAVLDSADPGCSKDMCNGRELNVEIKTNDSLVGGAVDANIQVKNNTSYRIDTTANKEGAADNYACREFGKVVEGNELEKPRKPCCDILIDNSSVNKGRRNGNDVESGKIEVKIQEVPVMIHQASQTDLEECVEDSGGIRFLSVPQKPVVMTPASISKPAQVINAVSKTAAVGKSPVAPLRAGVRTSLAPAVRQQPPVRPAYAAVSRLNNPASNRNHALSHTSIMTPRPNSNHQQVWSRTSTDVRPAGRGTTLRKLPAELSAGLLKSQRLTSAIRQVRNWMCTKHICMCISFDLMLGVPPCHPSMPHPRVSDGGTASGCGG
jgi:hypothetical protein